MKKGVIHMNATRTFETWPEPLCFEDSVEIWRLKKEFNHADCDTLERSIQDFDDSTKHHVTQYDAIIANSSEYGDLTRALALNECLLRDLKLRAVTAFEVGAEVDIVSHNLANQLFQLGLYLANIRESYKKERATLSRKLSQSLAIGQA